MLYIDRMFSESDKINAMYALKVKSGRRTMRPTTAKLNDSKLTVNIDGGKHTAVFEMDGAYIKALYDGDVIYRRLGKDLTDAFETVKRHMKLSAVKESKDEDEDGMYDEDGKMIDPDVWGIEAIVAIQTPADVIGINSDLTEGAAQPLLTDLAVKDVKRGDVLWITAILKPKDKSMAYAQGQLGVLKVRIVDLYYNMSVLKK